MKKTITAILSLVIWMSVMNCAKASNYMHWIIWVSDANHIATADELGDIVNAIHTGEIKPDSLYRLSTGTTYRVPKPDLYFSYLMKVYSDDPTVGVDNLYNVIKNDEVVLWDNNISVRVKNYYFSSLNNKIQFIENYSGADVGCTVLMHKGYPRVKMDCGNPLEHDFVRFTKPAVEEKQAVVDNTFKRAVIDNQDDSYKPPVIQSSATATQTTTTVQPKKHHGFWWWFWKGVIVCAIGGVVDWAVHQGSSPPPGGPGSAPLTTH